MDDEIKEAVDDDLASARCSLKRMVSLFDILTVACFAGLVIIYLTRTDQSPRKLGLFLGFGALLAVANQLGDHGYPFPAAALVAAAAVFGVSQAVQST